MNYPMAIIFSSALLVGSCVMNQTPAISQSGGQAVAKYQIVAAGPQSAWRIDTEKGAVAYCYADKDSNVFCRRASWPKK